VLVKRLDCGDRGFEHEHNLKPLSFGIIIVHVARNEISFYRPLFPQLLQGAAAIKAGDALHVYRPRVD
jgi:hypothetical protein